MSIPPLTSSPAGVATASASSSALRSPSCVDLLDGGCEKSPPDSRRSDRWAFLRGEARNLFVGNPTNPKPNESKTNQTNRVVVVSLIRVEIRGFRAEVWRSGGQRTICRAPLFRGFRRRVRYRCTNNKAVCTATHCTKTRKNYLRELVRPAKHHRLGCSISVDRCYGCTLHYCCSTVPQWPTPIRSSLHHYKNTDRNKNAIESIPKTQTKQKNGIRSILKTLFEGLSAASFLRRRRHHRAHDPLARTPKSLLLRPQVGAVQRIPGQ